jgi:hypothetical protein
MPGLMSKSNLWVPGEAEAAQSGMAIAARHTMQAAEAMYHYIVQEALAFQEALKDNAEIGAVVLSSGTMKTIHVRSISFRNPDIIILSGIDEQQNPIRLLQHYTMVSIAFVAARVIEEKPYRIGFLNVPQKVSDADTDSNRT